MYFIELQEDEFDINPTYSNRWCAESLEKLIEEYSAHLFEKDRYYINNIDSLYYLDAAGDTEELNEEQKKLFEEQCNEIIREHHNEYMYQLDTYDTYIKEQREYLK